MENKKGRKKVLSEDTGSILVKVNRRDYDALKVFAKANSTSMSAICRQLITDFTNRNINEVA